MAHTCLGRSRIAALAACIALALATSPARADNLRFSLFSGAVIAHNFGALDDGAMMGVGFENETGPIVSLIGEFEYFRLGGVHPYYTGYGSYDDHVHAGAVTLGLGLRLHAFPNSRVRPYTELMLGARVGGEEQYSMVMMPLSAGSGTPDPESIRDGTSATLRVGVTAARFGRSGLFLDGGVNLLVKNPADYALAPIRIGLTLR